MLQIAGLLYNLTDEAIRACPPSAQWVLATNGDNLYARDAFQAVISAPADADVVALDYYSRYQRTTGPPCARFAASPAAAPCKENRCHQCTCCQRALPTALLFVCPAHHAIDGLLTWTSAGVDIIMIIFSHSCRTTSCAHAIRSARRFAREVS